MLNKEVCKKCYNEETKCIWTHQIDEKRWYNRQIFCPLNPANPTQFKVALLIDIHIIPSFCIRGLEHLIANRQDEIDKKELEDA